MCMCMCKYMSMFRGWTLLLSHALSLTHTHTFAHTQLEGSKADRSKPDKSAKGRTRTTTEPESGASAAPINKSEATDKPKGCGVTQPNLEPSMVVPKADTLNDIPPALTQTATPGGSSDSNGHSSSNNRGCEVECVQIDAASEQGQLMISDPSPRPRPHLWIASGSTLNGQVGSPQMAEPTLQGVARSLRPGGHAIITGFTTSFLTPAMIESAGLRVLRASLPAQAAGGLEHDVGRFQFFVLQKPWQSPTNETETMSPLLPPPRPGPDDEAVAKPVGSPICPLPGPGPAPTPGDVVVPKPVRAPVWLAATGTAAMT